MSRAATAPAAPRSRALLLALILGLPLGVGLLVVADLFLPEGSLLRRYLQHPAEKAEVLLFCCAVVTLVVKLLAVPRQYLARSRPVLPSWDGKAVPATDADKYLNMAQQQPHWVRTSAVGQRREAVLHYVAARQTAEGLDDHMRSLADNDSMALDASYGLTRFITWAIPILGFLGTVLGITEAIAGVTPEILEQSLSNVTDGLALAFDTTALALGLTMVLMLGSFLTERVEQAVLQGVDEQVDAELAHRFQRNGAAMGPSVEVMTALVEKQAEVWARSLEKVDQRAAAMQQQQQETLTGALAEAIDRAITRQTDHLAALEEKAQTRHAYLLEQIASLASQVARLGAQQHQAVQQLADGLLAQAEVWTQIQHGQEHLVGLQAALQQNLSTLVATGSFDKALNALMAAIHLLNNRLAPTPDVLPLRPTAAGKAA